MEVQPEVAVAAALLRAGRLVAFPTETVYGLGADATNPQAVRRIFAAKGRPSGHPLIVHFADPVELERWGTNVPDAARRLAAAFWPGPLTLIVERGPGLSDEVTGGRATVGLRVPDHPLALALLAEVALPLAAPSANRFGRVSPTTAQDVRAELGDRVDLVLDGGPCAVGVESTIVEFGAPGTAPLLLRPGGVPAEAIEAVLGAALQRNDLGPARASGMLASHYAPSVPVEVLTGTALLAQAAALVQQGRRVGLVAYSVDAPPGTLLVARPADDASYARSLYRSLRDADEAGLDVLLVEAPPEQGLGLAVLDRLRRAAEPRPMKE